MPRSLASRVCRRSCSAKPGAVHRYSVRPSAPPSASAYTPVSPVEISCEHLAALADPQRPVAAARRRSRPRPRRPGTSRPGRRSAGRAPRSTSVVSGQRAELAQSRRGDSPPPASMSKALIRCPNVSATIRVVAADHRAVREVQRLGGHARSVPSGSTRTSGAGRHRRPAHQVEAEVADPGPPVGVHHHVVEQPGGVPGQVGVHHELPSGSRRSTGGRASTRPAAGRPAASPARTAGPAPGPPPAGRRRARRWRRPGRCRSRRPTAGRRASAGPPGTSTSRRRRSARHHHPPGHLRCPVRCTLGAQAARDGPPD